MWQEDQIPGACKKGFDSCGLEEPVESLRISSLKPDFMRLGSHMGLPIV